MIFQGPFSVRIEFPSIEIIGGAAGSFCLEIQILNQRSIHFFDNQSLDLFRKLESVRPELERVVSLRNGLKVVVKGRGFFWSPELM